LSRPTLYYYVSKVSRDLASEAKSFPAAYHPILTRLQYGCSTLGFSPSAPNGQEMSAVPMLLILILGGPALVALLVM
jgi:hypothetical protein